jgi:hypothetical protein
MGSPVEIIAPSAVFKKVLLEICMARYYPLFFASKGSPETPRFLGSPIS